MGACAQGAEHRPRLTGCSGAPGPGRPVLAPRSGPIGIALCPPVAGRRSFPTCGCATCTSTMASASVHGKGRPRSESSRWVREPSRAVRGLLRTRAAVAGRPMEHAARMGRSLVPRAATAARADLGTAQAICQPRWRPARGQPAHHAAQFLPRTCWSAAPIFDRSQEMLGPREHRDDANLHPRGPHPSEGDPQEVPPSRVAADSFTDRGPNGEFQTWLFPWGHSPWNRALSP